MWEGKKRKILLKSRNNAGQIRQKLQNMDDNEGYKESKPHLTKDQSVNQNFPSPRLLLSNASLCYSADIYFAFTFKTIC